MLLNNANASNGNKKLKARPAAAAINISGVIPVLDTSTPPFRPIAAIK